MFTKSVNGGEKSVDKFIGVPADVSSYTKTLRGYKYQAKRQLLDKPWKKKKGEIEK